MKPDFLVLLLLDDVSLEPASISECIIERRHLFQFHQNLAKGQEKQWEKSFRTVWKVSRRSGKFLDSLESF